MTAEPASADTATTSMAPVARKAAVPAPPSWPWMRGALILATAAQLITISALVSADPLAATWSALLTAAAAFAPAPVNLLAAGAAAVALAAGIIGEITHTGVLFVPALAVLAIGAAKLWRERG